jgi:hypothetical protein
MATPVSESQNYKNMTATTQVYTGTCGLLGIFVASASSTPTIQVLDGTAATSVTLANTFTPIAATFYPIPARVNTGLRIVISGTVDCTVMWDL